MQLKEAHHRFKFECQRCGQCCDSTIINLYPFDIKIICDNLRISIERFHQQYSMFKLDQDNIWRCALRNRPRCPFKSLANECTIYNFRPVRCRLYPLGRFIEEDKISYLISSHRCVGFDSNKKQSIIEWMERQGVLGYDTIAENWNKFLIKLKNEQTMNDQRIQEAFKKIFYGFEIQERKEHLKEQSGMDLNQFMDQLYEEFGTYLVGHQFR
ncbi:YkgJ family cysteine cluster protein [Candidatus Woesearchaeota archaeon]|nr:YkgJ family cysteine cluster protein [Candidatus Woesearchaeota archaeon]